MIRKTRLYQQRKPREAGSFQNLKKNTMRSARNWDSGKTRKNRSRKGMRQFLKTENVWMKGTSHICRFIRWLILIRSWGKKKQPDWKKHFCTWESWMHWSLHRSTGSRFFRAKKDAATAIYLRMQSMSGTTLWIGWISTIRIMICSYIRMYRVFCQQSHQEDPIRQRPGLMRTEIIRSEFSKAR